MIFTICSGIILVIHEPAAIAKPSTIKNARRTPRRRYRCLLVFEDNKRIDNCVLSPSSAIATATNGTSTSSKICFPLCYRLRTLEYIIRDNYFLFYRRDRKVGIKNNNDVKEESDTIIKKKLVLPTFIIILFSTISGCVHQEETSIDNNQHIIQKAIDTAENGATIIIKSGTYNELIVINKTITLISEDKNTTIINFNLNSTDPVPIITINADNCSLENLQITQGVNSVKTGGIRINSNYNTIKNTIITNALYGIELSAHSESNTITHNQIKNNYIGIESLSSTHNNISHNILSNNTQYNIHLSTSSDNNNVSYNILKKSNNGIRIKGSRDNNVYKNCISNNQIGLFCCCGASHNSFYNNTLINNSEINAIEGAGPNTWYHYPNGPGNYWDDYTGRDENHDGIGDTPYTTRDAENLDMYPLMTPPLDVLCN